MLTRWKRSWPPERAEVVDRAFVGAHALFWLAPPDPTRTFKEADVGFIRAAAHASRRHDAKRMVSITALGRGTRWADTAGIVTAFIQMDDLLMETGAALRALAMPSPMDDVAQQILPLKSQVMFLSQIDAHRKAPAAAIRDMGAAAARLLRDDSSTG